MSESAGPHLPVRPSEESPSIPWTERNSPGWLVLKVLGSFLVVTVLGFGCFYVAPAAYYFIAEYAASKVKPVPFNSKVWKELGRPTFLPGQLKRRYMAEDLLANHHLENMRRAEILDLLGPPDPGGFNSRDSVPYVFSYYLGPGMVEDLWLVLQFDVEDLVIDASITHD